MKAGLRGAAAGPLLVEAGPLLVEAGPLLVEGAAVAAGSSASGKSLGRMLSEM